MGKSRFAATGLVAGNLLINKRIGNFIIRNFGIES